MRWGTKMNEKDKEKSKLEQKMFDPCFMPDLDNGESLTNQYLNRLDPLASKPDGVISNKINILDKI